MSRPLRPHGAGLVYHVMARGNNKMTLYHDALDYRGWRELLARVVADYEIDCFASCPMPNHWHLVIRTRLPNVSRAMRQLDGIFAQRWNKRHAHVGHVLQARFKAQVVEDNLYLLRVCRYVWRNPVRAALCKSPEEWQWSNYRAVALGELCTYTAVDALLDRFGDDREHARKRLIRFVGAGPDADIAEFFRTDRRVIGSERFAARFGPVSKRAAMEVPARDRRVGTPLLADFFSSAIHSEGGLGAAILVAADEYGYSQREIAACTGLPTKTIARILRTARPESRPDPRFGRSGDLTPGSGDLET
jgi:REP-associated tyrosine transposase